MRILLTIVLSFTIWCSGAQLSLGPVKADPRFDCSNYNFLNPLFSIDIIDSLYRIPNICDSKNEPEVRFTSEYPPTSKVDLIILTYNEGLWLANKYEMYLDTVTNDSSWNASHNKIVVTSVTPVSNFQDFFEQLKLHDLFSLPDHRDLKVKSFGKCGTPYSITFKADNQFRTYTFQDPEMYLSEYPRNKYFSAYKKVADLFEHSLQ